MGEEDEVKQGAGSKIANTAKEKGKEAVKNQGKKAAKKVASKFSKKFAQKAASASMKGPMMMLMLKVLVVILIIMAIIGIIMFVVTMPGMVMEKLKALFKAVGKGIASWFGGDQTKLNAEDTKIYEILTYLEQMGYDLKGEGFITDSYTAADVPKDKVGEWEADKEHENTGVIRSKEDDSIVKADSLFVYNYLVSDNYVYTVKNFNMTTDDANGYQWWDAFQAIGGRFLNLFGNAGSEMWGRGLISLYHEDGEIGKRGDFYGNGIFHWNDIKLDAESKTLSIRRGWGSNKMVYSLDGWTGRYGMPLEFLLSIHLATKMPDLAYDMTKVFGGQNTDDKGTEIEILLHPLDNVSAITGYKKDFPTEGTDYITYGEMEEIKGEGWIFTDGWTLSKEEAFKIMSLGVKSPKNCTYMAPTFKLLDATDNGDGWFLDDDKKKELKKYGFSSDEEFADIEEHLKRTEAKKTGEKFIVEEAMQEVSKGTKTVKLSSAQDYDYNESIATENVETETINTDVDMAPSCDKSSHVKFSEIPEGQSSNYVKCSHKYGAGRYRKHYYVKKDFYQVKKTITTRIWLGENESDPNGEDATYQWITYHYELCKYPTAERKEGEGSHIATYLFEYILRELTTEELIQAGVLNEDGTAKEDKRCSDAGEKGSTEVTECCETCRKHVKKMMSLMKDGNDPEFSTYTPYISKVTNHWYRDVYFTTTGNQNFVQVDEEYEALMGERWTLYETDDNGQYVLYELNDDGTISNRKFNGTQQDANEQGVPVVKKAETIKITDTDANGDQLIDWVKNGNVWSAYKLNDEEVSTGWKPLYEGSEDELEKKIFLNITTKNDIVQVEEGQRTATNKDIRDMFLNNTYFRYDGSPETADTIDKLREKISGDDLKYGNLSSTDLSKLSDEEKQYTGKVELTQDSLSAFSMLENTHTLDADFIYKDFKELVVELGYFTKEELSDETPRIFAWMIPEIGSGGFPIASFDKKENEYGTQAHSKEDYEANVKNTMQAIISSAGFTEGAPDPKEGEEPVSIKEFDNRGILGKIADLDVTPMSKFITVGAIPNISPATITKGDSWVTGDANGTKKGDIEVNGIAYECWEQTHVTCTLYSFAFIAQAYTGESCEAYLKDGASFINQTGEGQGSNEYWSSTTYFQNDSFEKVGITGKFYTRADANVGEEIANALEEGKPIYFFGDLNPTGSGNHAVVLLGADSDGKVVFYDPGPGALDTFGTSSSFPANLENLINTHLLHKVFIPDEAPTGVKKSSGKSYEGFEGGEAVVSPVTGILLEYGTYQKGEIDPVTEKESRVNVDFIYTDNSSEETEKADSSGSPSPEPEPEPVQDVVDYVGYAKIMILDDETYLELEKQMKGSASKALAGMKDRDGNAIQSLVDKDGNYLENSALKSAEILTSDNESKKWSEDDITLYGYKEFAEMYSEFGVAGNIVFIDGFKCELPTTATAETEDSEIPETPKLLDGEDINKQYFVDNANNEDFDKTLYEKEERYNLSSLDATNKLNNENDIKAEADPIVMVGDKILIKEGTIIGRTMTNDEVMNEREKNGIITPKETVMDERETGKEIDGTSETPATQIVGNYLRIMMRDKDDTIVENVEEYFKLDEDGGSGISSESQEYQAEAGDLELLANLLHHEGCAAFFTGIFGGDSELGTAASRVTGYVLINRALSDYGGHGTTIREQILAPGQYSTAYDVTAGEAVACEECLANAEWCLTYDCSSVTNPDGDPMPRSVFGQSGWCQCNMGKFDCWWWIDTNNDGKYTEYTVEGAPFDTFYCE